MEALAADDNMEYRHCLGMASGKVYGSAKARSAHEMFHPIAWDETIFTGYADSALRLSTYAIPGSSVSGLSLETPPSIVPGAPRMTACPAWRSSLGTSSTSCDEPRLWRHCDGVSARAIAFLGHPARDNTSEDSLC